MTLTSSRALSLLLHHNADDDGPPLLSSLDSLHLTTLTQHFVLDLIETPNVSGYYLTRFITWAWFNISFKVTTPVLESLVSKLCRGPGLRQREREIDYLWYLVKNIGHNESGVLNVLILNQLIKSFSLLDGKGKAALEAFQKFKEFQCVPNKDTHHFTLHAFSKGSNRPVRYARFGPQKKIIDLEYMIGDCRREATCSGGSNELDRQAWAVCQKMIDLEYLPDDARRVTCILSWFYSRKMCKEAYAVFLAAKQKWKKQLPFDMNCFESMVITLCATKETVQLALEILNLRTRKR